MAVRITINTTGPVYYRPLDVIHIDGVMVSVPVSRAVDRGFVSLRVKLKSKNLVFAASPPSISARFSVSYHYKDLIKRVSMIKCGYHHHLIECNLFSL